MAMSAFWLTCPRSSSPCTTWNDDTWVAPFFPDLSYNHMSAKSEPNKPEPAQIWISTFRTNFAIWGGSRDCNVSWSLSLVQSLNNYGRCSHELCHRQSWSLTFFFICVSIRSYEYWILNKYLLACLCEQQLRTEELKRVNMIPANHQHVNHFGGLHWLDWFG